MKKAVIHLLCLLFACPALTRGAMAAFSTDATGMIQDGESRMRGNSAQLVMSMKINRPEFSRALKLRSWTRGQEKALVEIIEPAKEEGLVSLRVENQMWNYLPKADQVIRVPASLMLQSWMGSDFTNDDLMKMSSLATDYAHKILRREKMDGQETVLIECQPKPTAPVVWGKILYWGRVSDNLPVKEEFYDEAGKLVRTLTLGQFKRMDDRVIPTALTITKASNPAESTTVLYEKVLFDRQLDDSLFVRERLKSVSQSGRDMAWGWMLKPITAGS